MNNNIIRCPNNHLFDGSRFQTCPYCATMSGNTPTIPIQNNTNQSASTPIPTSNSENIQSSSYTADDNKTVRLTSYTNGKVEPIVGWLVCIGGPSFGKSYSIKENRNFIGRSVTMDIVIEDDMSISRERHAIITYVPNQRIFVAQPGESRELFYLNDKVVLNNEVLKAHDILLIGNTKLLFVPLCSDKFCWEDVKED